MIYFSFPLIIKHHYNRNLEEYIWNIGLQWIFTGYIIKPQTSSRWRILCSIVLSSAIKPVKIEICPNCCFAAILRQGEEFQMSSTKHYRSGWTDWSEDCCYSNFYMIGETLPLEICDHTSICICIRIKTKREKYIMFLERFPNNKWSFSCATYVIKTGFRIGLRYSILEKSQEKEYHIASANTLICTHFVTILYFSQALKLEWLNQHSSQRCQ